MGVNKISLRIGGPAGMGIMSTGLAFSKACSRIGLHVFDYTEYPSLIRGGHNTYQVRADEEPIHAQIKHVDALIALDEPTLTIHADELDENSIVVYDEETVHPENTKLKQSIRCPVPLRKLVAEVGGPEIMQNTVALAAVLGIVDYPFETFAQIIRETFDSKKAEIAQQNISVAKKGYDYAKQHYGSLSHYQLRPVKAPKRMVITGNEAIALGAVKGGMKFFSAYPMTPASSILHNIAAWQEKYGLVVKHAEDEISAANMVVGAGFAGTRAMTATSGGGFALMVEAISMAGIQETPVVFVNAQRPGPATGMPTWTEQGDMRFILHAGHGEFPRFVLAPGDMDECFSLTFEAFNIAEKYQTPVIILTDKMLAESHATMEIPDMSKLKIERGKILRAPQQNYLRYADSPDGVSPRTIPSVAGGYYLNNSYEHDDFGYSTEDPNVRVRMVQKRERKEQSYLKEMPQPQLAGAKDAELTIVCWGSPKLAVQDAIAWLAKEGAKVNMLQITHLAPFPAETVAKLLTRAKRTLLVENNATAQLAALIREKTGVDLKERMLRYDGRPFYPEDIYTKVKTMLGEKR